MKITHTYEELKKIFIDEALTGLTEKPIKSTTIERVRLLHEADELYSDLPQPLQYGKGFYYLLKNCSLPIKDTDLILGRIFEKELDEEEEKFFQSLSSNFARPKWIVDGGHRSFWWEGLIEYGLSGLRFRAISELERRQKRKEQQPDRIEFLEGAIWLYDAFILYLHRYADAAENAGLSEAAETCRQLTEREPQNFRQALQLLWIVQLIYCTCAAYNPTLTFGRIDLLLENLYENDKAQGNITPDEARLLILDYYCKNNLIMGRGEHQMSTSDYSSYTGWERNLCYDSPQYMLIGGRRGDGSYLDGELTHLFAEMIEPRFKNPVIEVRYAPDMQKKCPGFWRTVVDKARQSASLMIYNEEDNISAYIKCGVDPKDAFDFQHYGCNHPTLPGIECLIEYGSFVPLFLFLDILKKWVSEKHEPQTTKELYDAIAEESKKQSEAIIDRLAKVYANRMAIPRTYLEMTDCFYRYSIPSASSFSGFGSKYFCSNIMICSFASFIDVLSAVDELVIKQKKMSLAHLMEAVDANYEGYPIELALCKNIPKLGSDDPIPNLHAKELMTRFTDDIYDLASQKLSVNDKIGLSEDHPVIPRPIVRITMESDNGHLVGLRMGATPDGRLAGVPISQNSAPALGASTAGMTARLCSVASIPFERIVAGAHNLSIQPRAFSGKEGLDKLASILGGFFDMGGLQLQITAVDSDRLIEAQKNPDSHRDLMVRITGYSAVFVDMEKHAQDDIIRREAMDG